MSYLASLPDATLRDLFRRWPHLWRPLIEFHQQLLRGESPLSEGQRELLAAYVSRLNQCQYCESIHSRVAAQLGVADGEVAALAGEAGTQPGPGAMAPVLALARKLCAHPPRVERGDIEEVMRAGWDEEALFHIVATIALFSFMNRVVEGLGIEAEPRYTEMAANDLATRGYEGILQLLRRT